jgi:hypothetical protein
MTLNILWDRYFSLQTGDSTGEGTSVECFIRTELQSKYSETLGVCTMEDMHHQQLTLNTSHGENEKL